MNQLEEHNQRTTRDKCSRFNQQRLVSWRPDFTSPRSTYPIFRATGLIFISIGVIIFITTFGARDLFIDYTDVTCRPTNWWTSYATCAEYIRSYAGKNCYCDITIEVIDPFPAPVFIYYSLTNYYQNHRLYVNSKDNLQLYGVSRSYEQVQDSCYPYAGDSSLNITYAPCGLIAASMFNDTVSLRYYIGGLAGGISGYSNVPLLPTDIAWTTDKSTKFHNPFDSFSDKSSPPNWHQSVSYLGAGQSGNTGFENEDLIVWMRTAAFPTFRKLYRRVDHGTKTYEDGLPAGNYSLSIVYAYPVAGFSGRKYVIISTTSWLGCRNPFLGIAFVTCGVLFLLFEFVDRKLRQTVVHESIPKVIVDLTG